MGKAMKFNSLALVASFCVGMAFMILYTPKPEIVIKFPSPGSAKHLYHTSEGTCYRVNPEEVSCPTDRRNVLPQPVTEEDAKDPLFKYFA